MFRHIINAIFFWKLVVSITLFLFWYRKLVTKIVCEKMEKNPTLEKVLLLYNRNVELFRLVGATFDSKVASLRRMRKKNLINLKSLHKKFAIFLFVCCCWHLSCLILIESVWKIVICSLNVQCCILIFTQYYNNMCFCCIIIKLNFVWNIVFNNGVWSRRGLEGSVLAYSTKSQGSSPRPDIKMKYEKNFFGDFLSANFWQKLWESIKIAMKSFSKNLSFGVDFKL